MAVTLWGGGGVFQKCFRKRALFAKYKHSFFISTIESAKGHSNTSFRRLANEKEFKRQVVFFLALIQWSSLHSSSVAKEVRVLMTGNHSHSQQCLQFSTASRFSETRIGAQLGAMTAW